MQAHWPEQKAEGSHLQTQAQVKSTNNSGRRPFSFILPAVTYFLQEGHSPLASKTVPPTKACGQIFKPIGVILIQITTCDITAFFSSPQTAEVYQGGG